MGWMGRLLLSDRRGCSPRTTALIDRFAISSCLGRRTSQRSESRLASPKELTCQRSSWVRSNCVHRRSPAKTEPSHFEFEFLRSQAGAPVDRKIGLVAPPEWARRRPRDGRSDATCRLCRARPRPLTCRAATARGVARPASVRGRARWLRTSAAAMPRQLERGRELPRHRGGVLEGPAAARRLRPWG